MQATVFALGKGIPVTFDGSEGALFEAVGKLLKFIPPVNTMRIQVGDQYADFQVGENGTVQMICSGLRLTRTRYEKRYLTRVDPATNSYEFYKINPNNMGARTLSCGASYGRIGAEGRDLNSETVLKSPYPSCMYWLKYYEKLNQGYQDMSDIMLEQDEELEKMFEKERDVEDDQSTLAATLYNRLRQFAKDAVASQVDVNFLSEKPPFTKRQVDSGWKILRSLGESKSVDDFNAKLTKLLSISPRKVDRFRGQTIASYLAPAAKTPEEQQEIFASIIAREESLLQAMDAVVSTVSARSTKETVISPFGNVEISEPTKEETQRVIERLSDQLKGKVKKVYRVVPNDQQLKFDTYLAEHNIQHVEMFWHGSRNENWISIIKKSLMLNPNAVITGKMWGNGIYFAPSSMKSWNYTSYHGTLYASGNAGTAFMGLYATAYGNPYFPDHLMQGTKAFLQQQNADCIHAKAEIAGLRNDEVIFFDEDAICLQYLVEFGD